jgi:radical SAM protein with 4Fe4S-binding SPASM domain
MKTGKPESEGVPPPRILAWEVTRRCILRCRHCRGASRDADYEGELTTEEALGFLRLLWDWTKPLLILTGGEPLLRPDIFQLAKEASGRGLRTALATCGGPVTPETAERLRSAGVSRVSISIDGPDSASHDAFRGMAGSFEAAVGAARFLHEAGVPFQVNTTVTRSNAADLPRILALAASLGAVAFDAFLLVPTGRAMDLKAEELDPAGYEKTLHWIADRRGRGEPEVRATCAPHLQRILSQRGEGGGAPAGFRGCLGGKSFVFVSHRGDVQICGFLDTVAGNLRDTGLDLRPIWEESEFLGRIRDVDGYKGRCGACNYRRICGGCRARARGMTGDPLGEEPFCTYVPPAQGQEETS